MKNLFKSNQPAINNIQISRALWGPIICQWKSASFIKYHKNSWNCCYTWLEEVVVSQTLSLAATCGRVALSVVGDWGSLLDCLCAARFANFSCFIRSCSILLAISVNVLSSTCLCTSLEKNDIYIYIFFFLIFSLILVRD